MNPDLLLLVETAIAGFVLKTTLAFGLCLCLAWLAGSPSQRFMVWLSFLFGMAGYWLWLAKNVLTRGQEPSGLAGTHGTLAYPVASTPAVQIPSAWALPLSMSLRVVGIFYVLVLAYILFTETRKLRQLKWILGFTSQPPGEITDVFQPLAESLHARRSRLLVLSGATSPATFGWIRPIIVLPDVCLEQGRSQLEDVLRHELHHVRRWDFFWNGLAVVCRALLCFHPAAWFAVRRMQFDRELACDLAVVGDSPKRRAEYAECLIHFARLNSSQDSGYWGVDFAASAEHLKTRLHSILAVSKKPSPWLIGSRMAGGLTLLAGFLTVEPSLRVVITYAQEQITQPLAAEIHAPSVKPESRVRMIRKNQPSTPSAPAAAVVSLSSATDPDDLLPQGVTKNSPRPPAATGPQLLHRGSPASNRNTLQQTVVPIGDPSGQTSKGGDHDGNQAVQQTATTAVGIYRRLSVVDRH
jgi:beta-lactamase regulating signal transducer with metallopeptidase domain